MRVAFLLYDQLTQLDMTGPAQVLSRMPGAQVDYVAKTMDPVMSDCRLALVPTLTLAESGQFDLLCVPGGYGCSAAMNDAEILDWLRRQAPGLQWLTSVCTGSLILAAAGLGLAATVPRSGLPWRISICPTAPAALSPAAGISCCPPFWAFCHPRRRTTAPAPRAPTAPRSAPTASWASEATSGTTT